MEERPYRLPRRRPRAAWDAARVAGLRARLELTQAEFAAEIGVRQQTVSEWETGRYRPRGASARLLAFLEEQAGPYGDERGP
jgi:DNA-binding transcriptional regulator YiaG